MEEERDLSSLQPSMSLIIEDEESEDSAFNNSLLRESSIQSISINKADDDEDEEEEDTKISDVALLEMYDNLGLEYPHEDIAFEDDDEMDTDSSESGGSSSIGSNAGSVQINDEDSNGNNDENNDGINDGINDEINDENEDETNLYDFGNGELNDSPTSSSSSLNNNWQNTIRTTKDLDSILPPLTMMSISLIGSHSTSNESYHDYAEEEKSLQPTEILMNDGRSSRKERRAIMLEMRKKKQQKNEEKEDENRRKRRENTQNMNALKNKYQHQRRLREQNLHEISLNDLLAASSVEQEIKEENGELFEENMLSSPMSSSLGSGSASSLIAQPALSPNPQLSDDEHEPLFTVKRSNSSSPRKIDFMDLNDPIINHPPIRHSLLLDLTNMSSLACVVEEDIDDEEGEGMFQVVEYVRDSDYDSDGSVVINKEVYHEVTVGGLDYSNNEDEDEVDSDVRTSVL